MTPLKLLLQPDVSPVAGREKELSEQPHATVSALTSREWRQIVNAATHTAIISADARGNVTSWNSGAERIFGWSEAEMLGQSLGRLFPQDSPVQLEHEIADARAHGHGGGVEGWRCRKDGTTFWAVGELTVIHDDRKQVIGFTKVVRDRTAQRKTDERLREDRRMLELLNRAGSALSVENDLQKLVQIVTDTGVALTGAQFGAFFYNLIDEGGESYTLYTLSGAPLEAFSKFPMPRNTAVFGPTFRGEGLVRSDDITRDPRYGKNPPYKGMPEGHLPVRSYLALPVVSRSGEVLGGLFFGHATPSVFSEQSERALQGLAAEAAIAIDNSRLTQRMQREIEDRTKAETALRALTATLEQQVIERTEQLRKSEESLRQSQKMEAVGQLTGGIAHDFNNLLQVILGNLETLKRGLPREPTRLHRAVSQATNGAKRAASLTQRLLAFSRRMPLDPRPIDVNVLVNGLSDMLHRTLGETIELEHVLGGGLWRIEADANELEAAILNLALNARDAMPEGGRLTIETANADLDEAYAASQSEVVAGHYVAISVSDTGIGMDQETIAQAFEPFFTTKPVGKGTGLGLSQVYGFIKQSGGHVRIYSELRQGTTVRLYLPRLLNAANYNAAEREDFVPEAQKDETILVVEDDDDVRTYSVEALRDLGYRVIEAHDGPSALHLLEGQAVHLLFTDVVLPGGMTGAQAAAQARAIYPKIKVLFTTGYARNAIIHHGRLDRGVHLITKPFTRDGLAAKVRDVLDGP